MIKKKTTLSKYQDELSSVLESRSLCFLFRKEQILLGHKKEGFGKGNWLGIGGKKEQGESIEETAIRETQEEIGVTPIRLTRIGTLYFYFPYVEHPDKWNQQVCVFTVGSWKGDIKESEEIAPKWFSIDSIPYEYMWSDNSYWLPYVLKNQLFSASFLFDNSLAVQEYELVEGKF